MGYFSNGTEGMNYQSRYCDKCKNYRDLNDGRGPGCAIWDLHLLHSYDDCNNDKSYLHFLIPRTKDGLGNEKCTMFMGPKG